MAGPEAAVWQSYLAPSGAFWNLMQKFSLLTVEKFWLRNFFKSSAVFCLLVWQALCVWDLCEVPFLCDCSPLSCLHWHLVIWKEEFFHTAKGSSSSSSSTKARLISWMFRKGSQLFAWTLTNSHFILGRKSTFIWAWDTRTTDTRNSLIVLVEDFWCCRTMSIVLALFWKLKRKLF